MKAKRRIHVSNIPYELKKEEIIELFELAGPVIDCELINETNTNKFKGSAFIEYPDQFTAKSALRNLNRIEIKGRSLKISEAHTDKTGPDVGQAINDDVLSNDEDIEQKSATKEIEEVVKSLQPSQKYFLMGAMRELCSSNPEEFKQILLQDEKTFELINTLQKELKLDRPKAGYNMRKGPDYDMMIQGGSYQSQNTSQMYQQSQQSMMMNMQYQQSSNPISMNQMQNRQYKSNIQPQIMTNPQSYIAQQTLSPTGGKSMYNSFSGQPMSMSNQGYRNDGMGYQYGQGPQGMYGPQYHHMGDMDVQMGQHNQQHGQMGGMHYGGQYGDGNMGNMQYGGGNQGNMMYYNQNANRKNY